jgi:hypothetical protein
VSRRPRHRGERLPALFGFAEGGTPTEQPEEVGDNPLRRPCKTAEGGCGALVGERCTRPGRGGRKPMYHHFHDARLNPQPQETS